MTIESTLENLTNAINTLTAEIKSGQAFCERVESSTAKTVPGNSATKPKRSRSTTPDTANQVPAQVPSPKPKVTIAEVNKSLMDAQKRIGGAAKIMEVIHSYEGAQRINDVPPSEWDALIQRVEAL